ncbi:MAG: TIM barrel protein [Bacillota bacterium]|nr:TIM barrel protein [Bacillota bacterium]
MIDFSCLSVNTFDKCSLQLAMEKGTGLEIDDYLWSSTEEEDKIRNHVSELMSGFSRFSFHGNAVSRDVAEIMQKTDEEMLRIYNKSYQQARYHSINKIVFHSNYLSSMESPELWVIRNALFWKRFLLDKPKSLSVNIENFIDDTPDMLAHLTDLVDDQRLKICLDVGHAGCNSSINLSRWISRLGRRIGHVHLHNNDGFSDKHWPLGRGVLNIAEIVRDLIDYTDEPTMVLECDFSESLRWLFQCGILA